MSSYSWISRFPSVRRQCAEFLKVMQLKPECYDLVMRDILRFADKRHPGGSLWRNDGDSRKLTKFVHAWLLHGNAGEKY